MVLLDLDRESEYFEVVGPHGGPVISEGVQILQHHSEVIGPGGTISGGSIFFVTVQSHALLRRGFGTSVPFIMKAEACCPKEMHDLPWQNRKVISLFPGIAQFFIRCLQYVCGEPENKVRKITQLYFFSTFLQQEV